MLQTAAANPKGGVAAMDFYDVPGIDNNAAPFAKAQHYAARGNDAQKNGRFKRARTEPFGHTEMATLFRKSRRFSFVFSSILLTVFFPTRRRQLA